MIRTGEHVAYPLDALSRLLCSRSARARMEASRVAKRIIAGDASALAHVVAYVTRRRGWGRTLRKAVGSSLDSIDLDEIMLNVDVDLADGVTLRSMIRNAHPEPLDPRRALVYRDAMRGQ